MRVMPPRWRGRQAAPSISVVKGFFSWTATLLCASETEVVCDRRWDGEKGDLHRFGPRRVGPVLTEVNGVRIHTVIHVVDRKVQVRMISQPPGGGEVETVIRRH